MAVLAVAERDSVELHHAAAVRLPPGHEAGALVAARALLEWWLRRLVGPAEALMVAEVVELGPLAKALMLAWSQVAGARICGLALGWSPWPLAA